MRGEKRAIYTVFSGNSRKRSESKEHPVDYEGERMSIERCSSVTLQQQL